MKLVNIEDVSKMIKDYVSEQIEICRFSLDVLDINADLQSRLFKLETYEDSKIEVGDVVKVDGTLYTYVVTVIQAESDGMYYCGISKNGRWFAQNNVKKTGKHIDIQNVLERISEV